MWRKPAAIAAVVLLAACGTDARSPEASWQPTTEPSAAGSLPAPVQSPEPTIQPAPGSSSVVYEPNPGAIVVAIDAGHGGCLDWGVPDPSERGVQLSEKTLTLGIAQRLEALLIADGIGVLMIRDADEALAGDNYPPLDCNGPPWRDVNGDGHAGFGDEALPEGTRTRDELQARLDIANLVAADALISIHINSPTQDGQPVEIAFSETFYTDETPWGTAVTALLAQAIQDGVVAQLDAVAAHERADRGVDARNFYMVAPPLFEPSAERPDPWRQPSRGALMPVVLSEVGSITLRAEHDLLAGEAGQDAVARGAFDGLALFFGARSQSARIGLAGTPVDDPPVAVPGDGPPFWAPVVPNRALRLRLTNTGTDAWNEGLELVAGWEASSAPYLARPPNTLETLDGHIPALEAGESLDVQVELPEAPPGRGLAWISLRDATGGTFADLGSPALQVSNQVP